MNQFRAGTFIGEEWNGMGWNGMEGNKIRIKISIRIESNYPQNLSQFPYPGGRGGTFDRELWKCWNLSLFRKQFI